jgi:hypothetical protein
VLDLSRRGRHLPNLNMPKQDSQAKSPFPNHRGLATRGERLVPLEAFRREAAAHGRCLDAAQRRAAIERNRGVAADPTPVEAEYGRVAVFGGVYSNHLALEALLADAARRGAEALYCLGDLGGFGPNPEKVRPLLEQGEVRCIQGNYEASLAAGEEDCNCGYTDPRDNHFAALSYEYTATSCSDAFKSWMAQLPQRRRIRVGDRELLLVHGSPRQINEFLFYSTSPVAFLELLVEQSRCDGFLCTHTGLHWQRQLPSGRDVANVGVIGRPANDGRPNVWYCMLEAGPAGVDIDCVRLDYDHTRLAEEMRAESLPEEFVETILTGWWTTCLEILPAKERAASRF